MASSPPVPSTINPDAAPASVSSIINSDVARIDMESPYYLHSSDNPGAVLVSSPLTGGNYIQWQRAMTVALSAKNKLGFVLGTIAQPSLDHPQRSSWERVNNMVLSWMLNAIHPELTPSVLYADTAAKVWSDLKDRFSASNGPRIYALERSIATLQQNNNSIATYFNTLKRYWDELTQYNPSSFNSTSAIQQQRQLMQFLMVLNDSYSHVRSQILLMDPLPAVTKAYALLLQDESQRLLQPPSNGDGSAMFSKIVPNNRTQTGDKRARPRCSYCHLPGHLKEQCYKLHGYPPHSQLAGRPPSKQVATGTSSTADSVPNLTAGQYAQLLKLLNAVNSTPTPQVHATGPCDDEGNWAGP